jgi:RNA polymerase subunit RPABC4/transcription elongation factor Spt4
VQVCSKCNSNANDEERNCPNCQADLNKYSISAVFLSTLKGNPRVKAITLSVSNNACPACKSVQGTYEKALVPELPVRGCSEPMGCTCTYQPVLIEIFP